MPVPVQCEQCQSKYQIDDKFAGKRARCKQCGNIMAIPLPPGGGGATAHPNDDTSESGLSPVEAGPWGGGGARGGPSGVTSQVPRGWRPQDKVVERGEDVTDFALDPPFEPVVYTPPGKRLDWLVPVLLLAFVAGMILLGALRQTGIVSPDGGDTPAALDPQAAAAAADAPPAVISPVAVWGTILLQIIAFFAIVGPLMTAGVVAAGKLIKFSLPRGSYIRATAVAAVPALVMILLFGLLGGLNDPGIIAIIMLAGVGGAFLAVKYVFGTDWISTAAAGAGALVLGFVGFAVAGMAVRTVAAGALPPVMEVASAPQPRRRPSAPPTPPAPTPPATPTVPESPAAQPAASPPVVDAGAAPAGPPRRRVAPLSSPGGPTSPAPDSATRAPADAPMAGLPDAPVAGVPDAPVDPDALVDGDGLEITPEMRDRARRAAQSAAAAKEFVARLRESAGPLVTDARVIPLGPDVLSIVRPVAPSPAMAIVRGNGLEEKVELWNGSPPAKAAEAVYTLPPNTRGTYALSADGTRLVRVTQFPKLAARAWSPVEKKDVAAVELDANQGTPTLLGFLGNSPDRFLIRWEKQGQYGLEAWDLKTRRYVRRIPLPEHDPSPGNEAMSPDGRAFATAARIKGKSYLVLHSLFDASGARRFAILSLDEKWSIRPAGIAFAADSSKVAALFVNQGNALIVTWNVKTGKPISETMLSQPVEPLWPLGRVAVAGMQAGMASAPSLDWIGAGGAWLVCGTNVVDPRNGTLLFDLAASDVFDQAAVSDRVVHVAYKSKQYPEGLAVITIDPRKLPMPTSAAAAAPIPPSPVPRATAR